VIRVLGVLAAFVRRDAASELSYRLPFALDLASTALSLALFFYLGRFIDRTGLTGEVGVGTNYFSFLITGLLLLTLAGTALGAFAGRVREDQVTGTFEALLAAPISPSVIIAGSGAYAVLRQAAELVVSVALAVIVFGVRPQLGWEAAVVVLVALPAFLVFFAAAGIAIAALTVVVKKVTAVLGLVTSGLALLGGVYYPVSVLPQPLEAVAQVIPFTWGAEVVRGWAVRTRAANRAADRAGRGRRRRAPRLAAVVRLGGRAGETRRDARTVLRGRSTTVLRPMPNATPVTAVVVTKDEEDYIARCIRAARFADEVLVIDSGSTDRTCEIARSLGATVIEAGWPGWAEQRNLASGHAKNDWIFALEVDEVPDPALESALRAVLGGPMTPGDGYAVDRRHDFLGQLLPTETRPKKRRDYVRLYHRAHSEYDTSQVIHHEVIVPGRSHRLDGLLLHWRGQTLTEMTDGFNMYATLEADKLESIDAQASAGQIVARPVLRFLWTYVWKGGFRSGTRGLIYALMKSHNEFLRYAKLWERQHHASAAIHPPDALSGRDDLTADVPR